jgi:hypothetical protein
LIQPVSGLQLGEDQVADITVKYTSYRRGDRVALLKGFGFTRDGTYGYWHGRVDAPQLDRVTRAFPDKVQVHSVHAESTSIVNAATDESTAVSEASTEAVEVDATPAAIERSEPQDSVPQANAPAGSAAAHPAPQPASTSTQLPRAPFTSWPGRASTAGVGGDGEKLQ